MIPLKNILIVRTDRIGDVVLTLPLASIIKKHFPHCKVTCLLREYTKPLALNNPYIDNVLTVIEENGKTAIGENVARLKNKFDACIVAFPTYPVALILFLSNIPSRIGTGYRWYSFLFNKKVYEHRKYGEKHELEFNVGLLKQIGIDEAVDENNVKFGLAPTERNELEIRDDLKNLKVYNSKPIIIVHPGSGGSAVDLPINKMKDIVHQLSKEDVTVIITGNQSEIKLCESFVINKNVINTAGKYELGRLTALINLSSLMIANSTGPLHIAAALGKNVIGFYPKFTTASAKRWGPYTTRKIIFVPSINCTDCTRKQCEKLNCMDSINVEEVVIAAKKFLEIK